MATTTQVLNYLRPNGGWVIYNEDLSTIIYDDGVKPVTQEEIDINKSKVDDLLKSISDQKIKAKSIRTAGRC